MKTLYQQFLNSNVRDTAQRARNYQASKALTSDSRHWSPKGLDYEQFQSAGIDRMLEIPNVLQGDEMGLGKTVQALGLINQDGSIRRVLVICPATIKSVWFKHSKEWLLGTWSIGVAQSNYLPIHKDIVIINYDILSRHIHALHNVEWDIVIVDEGHKLKDAGSIVDEHDPENETGSIRNRCICGGIARVEDPTTRQTIEINIPKLQGRRNVVITGTPSLNRPVEIWPLWNYLDPENCPSYYDFTVKYCARREYQKYIAPGKTKLEIDVSGSSNLEELQTLLRSTIMVRRKSKDVYPDRVEPKHILLEVDTDLLSATQIKKEKSLWENVKKIAGITHDNEDLTEPEFKAMCMAMQSDDPIYGAPATIRRELGEEKVPVNVKYAKSILAEEEKLVIFAYHRSVIQSLQESFGSEAVSLYGGMNDSAKNKAVVDFQENPKIRVFILQLCCSEGLTLTAACVGMFAEIDHVPGNIQQSWKRLDRMTQTRPVIIQYPLVPGSMDSRMIKNVTKKQKVLDRMLG